MNKSYIQCSGFQRVMKVPDDKELPFSSDSEPESKPIPQEREKPSSPSGWSTPKRDQPEEKVPRRVEPTELSQIRRKTADVIEKTKPGQEETEK